MNLKVKLRSNIISFHNKSFIELTELLVLFSINDYDDFSSIVF